MKKQRQKASTKGRKPADQAQSAKGISRREMMGYLQYAALGLVVLGGGGYFVATTVSEAHAERDLSRVGQGMPSIVQIHDPQCPRCAALQRATKEALERIGEGRIDYMVADIRTAEGATFAQIHGVPHITLLLFDGEGALREVIRGETPADQLEVTFRRHIAAHSG